MHIKGWMDLRGIPVSEKSQSQTMIYNILAVTQL